MKLICIIIITILLASILWLSMSNMFIIGEINHIYMLQNQQYKSTESINPILSSELFTSEIRGWYINIFVFIFGFLAMLGSLMISYIEKINILKFNVVFIIQYLIIIIITYITLIFSFSHNSSWNFINLFLSFIIFIIIANIANIFIKHKNITQ